MSERPTSRERYLTLDMLTKGCVSGRITDWPVLKVEANAALTEINRLVAEVDRLTKELDSERKSERALANWIRSQRCSMNPCGGVRLAPPEVAAAMKRAGNP